MKLNRVLLLLWLPQLTACSSLSLPVASYLPAAWRAPASAEQQLQWQQQGSRAYQQGDLLSAEQIWLTYLEQQPNDIITRLQLANVQFRQGRLDAAQQNYQQVLRLDSRNSTAWHNLAIVQLRQTTASLLSARQQQVLDEDGERLLQLLLRLQRGQQLAND